ncbi:MAG: hypothetical protein IJN92_10105 [Lachnospiraceae bacterium]|nr:hypothetical protein [Lachnospiraceae bacterium]
MRRNKKNMDTPNENSQFLIKKCSFCDKIREQVYELAYDRGTFICDECIAEITIHQMDKDLAR